MGKLLLNKKNRPGQFLCASALMFFLSASATSLAKGVPDFYMCSGKVVGEWAYGRAPYACNANVFGDDQTVYMNYGPLLFNDQVSRPSERNRYMQELYSVLRDAAQYYLKKRKPQVSAEELRWWTLGMMATASQESYWSHYRVAGDGRLKMMRGDFGHGHGLMQVDDRSHFDAVKEGVAWNLLANFTYAMDILYGHWQKAPKQACVQDETHYEARVRSAWSAYNGGASQFCRWTRPQSRWARNDINFLSNLRNLSWEDFVASKNKASSINVICLIESRENCPQSGSGDQIPPQEAPLVLGQLYQTSDGNFCVIKGDTFFCTRQYRDSLCLSAVEKIKNDSPVKIDDNIRKNLKIEILDRHQICSQYDRDVYPVSSVIETQKAINLRQTPGGGLLQVLPAHAVVEVLDVEVRNPPHNDRYFKIFYKSKTGFIYGGDVADFKDWATLTTKNTTEESLIARPGQWVTIKNKAGINLRSTPAGALMASLPVRSKLLVSNVEIVGDDNFVYYLVNYRGWRGYIYSGRLIPDMTTDLWTKIEGGRSP